tara:strand:- start:84 stop:794 length:711 start_codon:yes stop_codon:yes gene_type:complete
MSPIPSIIGGAEAPSNTTVNQPQTTTTATAPAPATNQSTAPVQPPAQLPKEKTLADVLKTFLADIGFDKQENKIDEQFRTFLDNTFSGFIIKPEYKSQYNKQSYTQIINNIASKIKELDLNISKLKNQAMENSFRMMIQNLIKVNIFSHYDKESKKPEPAPLPPKSNDAELKRQYESMITDILGLVNQSLNQSNKVFENRLKNVNQSGGSISDSKINVMSKYFKYKLKYMMLKNNM